MSQDHECVHTAEMYTARETHLALGCTGTAGSVCFVLRRIIIQRFIHHTFWEEIQRWVSGRLKWIPALHWRDENEKHLKQLDRESLFFS